MSIFWEFWNKTLCQISSSSSSPKVSTYSNPGLLNFHYSWPSYLDLNDLLFFLSWLLCAFSFLPFYTDNTLTWLGLSLAMAPGFLEFPFVQTTRTSFQGMLCFPFIPFRAFFSWSACTRIASPVISSCELPAINPAPLPSQGKKVIDPPSLVSPLPSPPSLPIFHWSSMVC